MRPHTPGNRRAFSPSAILLRGLIHILNHWLLFLIAAMVISPIGPHLRVRYSYVEFGGARHMVACEYFGSRGIVQYIDGGGCPIVTIIDTRKYG